MKTSYIGKIYFDVPYENQSTVYSLGARYDHSIGKWCYIGDANNYIHFSNWIMGECKKLIIASENIYLLETQKKCWRCGKKTKVIALGIGQHVHMHQYRDFKKHFYYTLEIENETKPEIHLAWIDDEKQLPTALLKYIKKLYSAKNGYSKTSGNCFANHCDYCGAIQGNNYIFTEVDSPFSTLFSGKEHLKEHISKIDVYRILIDSNLFLDWELSYSCNDYAYLMYGNVKDLVLSQYGEPYISYQEMYELI